MLAAAWNNGLLLQSIWVFLVYNFVEQAKFAFFVLSCVLEFIVIRKVFSYSKPNLKLGKPLRTFGSRFATTSNAEAVRCFSVISTDFEYFPMLSKSLRLLASRFVAIKWTGIVLCDENQTTVFRTRPAVREFAKFLEELKINFVFFFICSIFYNQITPDRVHHTTNRGSYDIYDRIILIL